MAQEVIPALAVKELTAGTLKTETFTFPSSDGANTQVLTTDGAGTLSWSNQASGVSSVFTRTGAVVAAADDYTKEQITGLKTTDSPTFAGLNSTGFINVGAPVSVTLSSGNITITSSFHTMNSESAGNPDQLDNILGGTAGDILFLKDNANTEDITIKDSGGNIRTGGADITLINTDSLAAFIFDGTIWHLIGFNP